MQTGAPCMHVFPVSKMTSWTFNISTIGIGTATSVIEE